MSEGALIQQYRIMHAEDPRHFPGRSLLPVAWRVYDLVRKHRTVTLLDYGCGQGQQYDRYKVHDWWGVPRPALYDPAVARHAARPEGSFDGVICTDVLEHVPDDEIDGVLADCFGHAHGFVFFSVCCRPAKRSLPNGANCHVTLREPAWWGERLRNFKAARGTGAALNLVFTP